ncbi:APC family permease [Nakamurella endophytica]|uniref:Amino acid permease n=1 Tax=Nakamurella endophytica TaxID=1748367 RepID=A0A917T0J9_9ACTN|nr:amino acid permease [Nakamurella endophytica]GGM04612.1 amino acid permease [Nakamurella endophytica]
MTVSEEDARLAEFGYTQKLDRSVGRLASFCIGFSVISATTAVYSSFGFGLSHAGPAFVWTFPIAAAVFFVWAVIAGDLAAKIPLAGYAYQWTSRLVGPTLGWFTGFAGLVGFISGFTGVAYIMSSYLGGLFGWELSDAGLIWVTIAIVLVCVVINAYGVRLATLLNNIGVTLELVVTLAGTLIVAAIVFFVSTHHQTVSFLFTKGDTVSEPYLFAWLTSSLGCIFGLLGVEASADVAEETKAARRTIPRTMLYALGVSSAIEFLMYIVFLLGIDDPAAVSASGAPIADIMSRQVAPWFSKAVVAVALTNILVCVLSNMLVATRLMYSISRDNMVPGARFLSHVSPGRRTPSAAVWSTGILSILILLSALVNAQAFAYIIGLSALGYFTVYVLTTGGLVLSRRRGNLPAAEPGTFDLGRMRTPVYTVGLVVFAAVLAALLLLPEFRANGRIFLYVMIGAGVWWALGLRPRLRRGDAGPAYSLRNRTDPAPDSIPSRPS